MSEHTPAARAKTLRDHQLGVWNAILNPPESRSSLADLVFDEVALAQRNVYVEDIEKAMARHDTSGAQNFRMSLASHDAAFDFDRLMLGGEDIHDMESILDRRDELAKGKLAQYGERGVTALNTLRDEVVDRILREAPAGLVGSSVRHYVDANLFANYQLDRHGRAVSMPDHQLPAFEEGFDSGFAGQIVRQYNDLVGNSADYMVHGERVWKLLEDGVDRGRLDPSVFFLLNTVAKGKPVSSEAYVDILSRYGIVTHGRESNVEAAENMLSFFLVDWYRRGDEIFDGFRNQGAEPFSLDLYNRAGAGVTAGPEDLPVVGSHQRRDRADFAYFRDFNWEFDKDVGYNIEKILKDKRFEGLGFHPGVDRLPEAWEAIWDDGAMRSVLRTSMRMVKDAVGDTEATDVYRAEMKEGEASVEAGYRVFTEFMEHFGNNGSKYSKFVVKGFGDKEDLTWAETVRESNLRTSAAKEFLYQVLDSGETASDELIKKVEDRLAEFTNLRDMLEGPNSNSIKTWARRQHQDRLDQELFSDAGINMDDVDERTGAFFDFLKGYLGSAEYAEFLNGEKNLEYHKMVDYFQGFKGVPEAKRDYWFLDQVNALVADYTQVSLAAREKKEAKEARAEEIAAEKAISDDTIIFTNRLSRLFREFGPDGEAVVGPYSDRAFVDHIEKVVIPRIVQKAYHGGEAFGTEKDVRNIFDQATAPGDDFYGLRPFDFDEEFYSVQFDEDRPPGFPGGKGPRFVEPGEYAPRFDTSAFAGEIDAAAIESPEFASFLAQEIGEGSFEEAWQEAALPKARRDRGAELQAADDRVASFQAAYDRAVASWGAQEDQVDVALRNYQDVVQAGGDEAAIMAAQDALTQAESAKQSGLAEGGAVARAQAALADAKARAAREKGEVTAEYFVMGKPGLQTAAEKARIAAGGIAPGPKTLPTGKQVPVTSLFTQEGGVWNIDPYQYARERREAYIKPGLTQREFYERELPGLTERYEGSYLQFREQQRLEEERFSAEEKRLTDERAVEARRRSRLSASRAMSVFGRRA
jgi:hypothetical protein